MKLLLFSRESTRFIDNALELSSHVLPKAIALASLEVSKRYAIICVIPNRTTPPIANDHTFLSALVFLSNALESLS